MNLISKTMGHFVQHKKECDNLLILFGIYSIENITKTMYMFLWFQRGALDLTIQHLIHWDYSYFSLKKKKKKKKINVALTSYNIDIWLSSFAFYRSSVLGLEGLSNRNQCDIVHDLCIITWT